MINVKTTAHLYDMAEFTSPKNGNTYKTCSVLVGGQAVKFFLRDNVHAQLCKTKAAGLLREKGEISAIELEMSFDVDSKGFWRANVLGVKG